MAKRKQTYGLDRVAFNREAKRLRADDDLPALKELAVKQVFPKPYNGSPVGDLWQVLTEAAVGVVADWWKCGGKLPYDRITKAIKTAGRTYRGQGGSAADVTWRGPLNTDTRKFLSHPDEWTQAAAVELAAAFGETPSDEAPEPTEADERDQRDAELDRLNEHKSERAGELHAEEKGAEGGANIATGAAVMEGGAERTGHDGGHADDVRLNPRDDGETAYGVDGATRGLHTGGLVPSAYFIAWQMAVEAECSDADRAFLLAIDKAGGFQSYVNKDGNRKSARAALEARRNDIEGRLRRRALSILEA